MKNYNVLLTDELINQYNKLSKGEQIIFFNFFQGLESNIPYEVAEKLKFNENSYRVQVLTYTVVFTKDKNDIEVKGIFKHPQADFFEFEGRAIEALSTLLMEQDYTPYVNHVITFGNQNKIFVDALYKSKKEKEAKYIIVETKKNIRGNLNNIINQLISIKNLLNHSTIMVLVIPPEEYDKNNNKVFYENEIIVCTYDIRENVIKAGEILKQIG